jgi:hypothetical protein
MFDLAPLLLAHKNHLAPSERSEPFFSSPNLVISYFSVFAGYSVRKAERSASITG